MAKILRVDGSKEDLDPENGSKYISGEQLHKAVGGYIEHIAVPNCNNSLFVDEDGIRKNLPLNAAASALTGIAIVGDVVLCSNAELET